MHILFPFIGKGEGKDISTENEMDIGGMGDGSAVHHLST